MITTACLRIFIYQSTIPSLCGTSIYQYIGGYLNIAMGVFDSIGMVKTEYVQYGIVTLMRFSFILPHHS